MSRASRMQPVQRHARQREDRAAREMRESQTRLEQQEQQLELLRQYREEYLRNWQVTSGAGVSMVQMRNYRSFLERIGSALEQQQAAVQGAREDLERARNGWLSRRRRREAVSKVQQRLGEEERRDWQRREQKETDDWVAANSGR